MARVIGIVSGKGGVGKTVTAANLGLALHEFNQDVVVVDADLTSSNLGFYLGLYSPQPFTLQNVLNGDVNIAKAIYIHPTGLKIVPSSLALEYVGVKANRLGEIVKHIKSGTVIVDSPAGLDREALAVLDACNDVIVVTNPELPAVTDALKVIHAAREKGKNILGIVVNRFKNKKHELKISEIEMMTETPVISVIHEDKNVKKSLFEKVPLLRYRPYSIASLEIRRLAAMLLQTEYVPPRFARLKNLFGKYFANKYYHKHFSPLFPPQQIYSHPQYPPSFHQQPQPFQQQFSQPHFPQSPYPQALPQAYPPHEQPELKQPIFEDLDLSSALETKPKPKRKRGRPRKKK